MALRVALMDGRVIETRRGQSVDFDVPAIRLPRTTKHSAGYRLAPGMDMVGLFVGSEGTLGIVTQAELRLLPPPAELTAASCSSNRKKPRWIPSIDGARGGLRMLEYLDAASLAMMDVARHAALIIEYEGDVDLDMTGALEDESWFAVSAADRERFRKFRHALPERVNDRIRRSGFMKLSTDYAVPIDKGREMLAIYRKMIRSVICHFRARRRRASAHQYVFFVAARVRREQSVNDGSGSGSSAAGGHGRRGAWPREAQSALAVDPIFAGRDRGDARSEAAIRFAVAARAGGRSLVLRRRPKLLAIC